MSLKERVVDGYCVTTVFTRVTWMASFNQFRGAHITEGHTAVGQ